MATEFSVPLLSEEEEQEQAQEQPGFSVPLLSETDPEKIKKDALQQAGAARSDQFSVPLLQDQEGNYLSAFKFRGGKKIYDGLVMSAEQAAQLPGRMLRSAENAAMQDLIDDLDRALGEEGRSFWESFLLRGGGFKYNYEKIMLENKLGLADRGNLGILYGTIFGTDDTKRQLNYSKLSRQEKIDLRNEIEAEAMEHANKTIEINKKYNEKKQKLWDKRGYNQEEISAVGGVSSLAVSLTSMAAAVFTKKPQVAYGTLPYFGLVTQQESYENGIAKGLSDEDARKNSYLQGGSEVASELLTQFTVVKSLSKYLKGQKQTVKQLVKEGGVIFLAEGFGEQMNTAAQSTFDAMYDNQDELRIAWDNKENPLYTGRDWRDIMYERARLTSIASLVAGGGIVTTNGLIKYNASKNWIANSTNPEATKESVDNLILAKDLEKVAFEQAAAKSLTEDAINDPTVDPMENLAEEILKVEYPDARSDIQEDTLAEDSFEARNEAGDIETALINIEEILKGKNYDPVKLGLTVGKSPAAEIRNEPPDQIKLMDRIGFNVDLNNLEATAEKIDQFMLDQGAKKNFIAAKPKEIKGKLDLPKKFVPGRAQNLLKGQVPMNAADISDFASALGLEPKSIPLFFRRKNGPTDQFGNVTYNIGDNMAELLFESGFGQELNQEDRPSEFGANEAYEILRENPIYPEQVDMYNDYLSEMNQKILTFINENPGVTFEEIKKAAGRRSPDEIFQTLERLRTVDPMTGASVVEDTRSGETQYFIEEQRNQDIFDEEAQDDIPSEYEDYMAMLEYDKYFDQQQGAPVVPELERYVPSKPALKPNKSKKPLVVDDGDGGKKNLDGGSNITDDSWGIGYESLARKIKSELEFHLQNVVGRVKDVEKARDRRAEEIGGEKLTIAEKPSEAFARLPGVRNEMYKESLQESEAIINLIKEADLFGDDVDLVARAMHAPERNRKIYKDKTEAVDNYIESLEAEEAKREKTGELRFDPETGKAIVGYTKAEQNNINKLQQEAAKFQNNGSGIQTDEAYRILGKYGIEYRNNEFVAIEGSNTGQAYLDIVSEYHKYIKRTVDLYDKAGLIDEAVAEDYRSNANYKYYVPLSGYAADTNVNGLPNKKGKGVSIVGKENEKATGRTSLSDSPLVQMTLQRQRAIDRSSKNDVLIDLANLVRNEYDNSDIASVGYLRPKNMEMTFGFKENGEQKYLYVNDERLARALNAFDDQSLNAFNRAFRSFSRLQSALYTTLSPAFVFFNFFRDFIAGGLALKTEQMLPGGRAEGKAMIDKVLFNTPKRLAQFKRGITGKVKIKEEGIQEAYDLFNKYGAGSGFVTVLREDRMSEFYDNMQKQHDNINIKEVNNVPILTGLGSAAKATWNGYANFMGDINSAVENGIRFSSFVEFVKAENNGKISGAKESTLKQAASLAKQLTIDYTTKGYYGAFANSHFIFFNAAVQSNIPLYRALGKSPKVAAQIGGGIATGAALITIYNFLVSDEDETGRSMYQNLSDRFGNRYIIVMLPNVAPSDGEATISKRGVGGGGPIQVDGRTVAFAIPQPLGFNIPYNIARNAVETSAHEIFDFNRPQKTVGRAAIDTFDNFSTGVFPIGVNVSRDTGLEGFAKTSIRTLTPTYAKPLAEIAVNENFFGAPVTKEYLGGKKDLPNSSVVTPYDKTLYINMARFINNMTGGDNDKLETGVIDLQPGQIDYIVNYYGGGPMSFITGVYNQVHRAVYDEVRDVSKTPVINSLIIQEQDGVYARRFYDAIQDIEGKVTRYKVIKETNPTLAQEYLNENKSVIKLDYLSEFDEELRRNLPPEARGIISKEMTAIRNLRKSIKESEQTLVALNLYKKDPTRWYEKSNVIKEQKRDLYIDLLKEYEKAMTEDRNRKKEEQD